MSAVILQFPRRKPMEDHEYPAYWGFMEKSYYDMLIEEGVSHEDAFAEWDGYARRQLQIQAEFGSPREQIVRALKRAVEDAKELENDMINLGDEAKDTEE